jgi:hypothetical protein
MKTLAKIILASSLITLAACSGKGSGDSRIHSIPSDEDENPASQVIDDEDVIPSETPSGEDGPKGNVIACRDMSGAYCAETTDMSLKSECDEEDGEMLLDKCPSGGTKCNLDIPDVTFYVYNGLVDCKTLEAFMNADWE